MELKRQQPIVEAYHFYMKPKDKEMETKLNVGFAPLKVKDEEYREKNAIAFDSLIPPPPPSRNLCFF